ncbi:DUF1934 domain-containing protein [Paenibacillus sp. TRM 82003]|nr:DUF1934 domain-containing protein [Paenibacillus sp. TRM 82003]
MKRNVRIRLTTVHDGNRTVVEANGESYVKGKHTYIRYIETAPDFEGVVTLVKAGEDGVSVLRQGKVRMEQRYVPGKPAGGYYETPETSFRLETTTERVDVRFENGVGTASWAYTLMVGGGEAGRFQVNLDVREDTERT